MAFARYGNFSLSLFPTHSLSPSHYRSFSTPSLLPSAQSSLFSSTYPLFPLFLHKATNKTPLHTYIPVGQEWYGSGYTPTNYYQRCPGILAPKLTQPHYLPDAWGVNTATAYLRWVADEYATHTHTHTHSLTHTHTQYYTTLHVQEHYI